jgi:hypothetical protein
MRLPAGTVFDAEEEDWLKLVMEPHGALQL